MDLFTALRIWWAAWLKSGEPKAAPLPGSKGWRCSACHRHYQTCTAAGECGDAPMEPIPL